MPQFTLIIPDWHPAKTNQLLGCHWAAAARRKRLDRELVAAYALAAQAPKATSKRRLDLLIVLGKRERGGDPDCYYKSLNDALVHCGLLKDDSKEWVELGEVNYSRGLYGLRQTEITLTWSQQNETNS